MTKQTVVMVLVIATFNLLAWSPVLLSPAVRRLFNLLPSQRLSLNYLMGIAAFTVMNILTLLTVVVFSGGLEGSQALWGPFIVNLLLGSGTWLLTSFLLPRKGFWDPKKNEEEMDGRIALGLGALVYIVGTAFLLFLIMIVLIGLYFPG